MTTRCFAFGCSFTGWPWATCADFIGANFNEYFNVGKPGASNIFIMNRLVEIDNKYKLNSDTDTVIIGMTGFSRLSYWKRGWQTHGDILWQDRRHPEAVDIFNHEWALYSSYVAMKTIKSLLSLKNIKHKIYAAIEYDHWITDPNLMNINPADVDRVKEIESLLDITFSLERYVNERREKQLSKGITFVNGYYESHPTQQEHYSYMCKYFPEYNTQQSADLFKLLDCEFDYSSINAQTEKFKKIYKDKHYVNQGLFL